MNRIILVLVASTFLISAKAQDTNCESHKVSSDISPLGLSFGSGFLENEFRVHACVDYMYKTNLSAEINIGSWLNTIGKDNYLSLGGKYWFENKYSKIGFYPYTGLLYNFATFRVDGGVDRLNIIEIPAGLSYFSKKGFHSSLQISYFIGYGVGIGLVGPNIELKLGWRFNLRK